MCPAEDCETSWTAYLRLQIFVLTKISVHLPIFRLLSQNNSEEQKVRHFPDDFYLVITE